MTLRRVFSTELAFGIDLCCYVASSPTPVGFMRISREFKPRLSRVKRSGVVIGNCIEGLLKAGILAVVYDNAGEVASWGIVHNVGRSFIIGRDPGTITLHDIAFAVSWEYDHFDDGVFEVYDKLASVLRMVTLSDVMGRGLDVSVYWRDDEP